MDFQKSAAVCERALNENPIIVLKSPFYSWNFIFPIRGSLTGTQPRIWGLGISRIVSMWMKKLTEQGIRDRYLLFLKKKLQTDISFFFFLITDRYLLFI